MTLEQYNEALRRLAILADYGMYPPRQHWVPDAQGYDVTLLAQQLLDDQLLCEHVQSTGKGLEQSGYFMRRLLNKEEN